MTSNPVRGDVESPSKDGPAFTALQQDSEFEHVGPEIGFETEKIGHEFMSWDLWRAAIAEFIGMVFFLVRKGGPFRWLGSTCCPHGIVRPPPANVSRSLSVFHNRDRGLDGELQRKERLRGP